MILVWLLPIIIIDSMSIASLSKFIKLVMMTSSSGRPSDFPTDIPSDSPTDAPSHTPSDAPSNTPSDTPTDLPSDTPTDIPTDAPSLLRLRSP